MLHKETHDEDLDDLDINKNDYTDDDDIDGEEENITLSKSEYDAMQKKLGKLEKNVKHHKERRRQETQNVPDVSELVQKEIQMIQERQKVQATYPNVDIAKAEVTARQK
jgi:hypothetical protein